MTNEIERNGVLLTVRLPEPLLFSIDEYVQQFGRETGQERPSRAAAIRHLLALALERARDESKLRTLRSVVAATVRVAVDGRESASLAHVREQLALVPRDLLDRTLLDLEQSGVVVLLGANGTALDERAAAASIQDPARGTLASVALGAAMRANGTALQSLDGQSDAGAHDAQGERRASAS